MRIVAKIRIEKHHDKLAIHILSQEICKVSMMPGREFEQLERLMYSMVHGNGSKCELYLEVNTNLPTDSVPEIVEDMVLHVNSLLVHYIQICGPQMKNAVTYDRIVYYFKGKGWII